MEEVHKSLTWTQSDTIADVISAESCHIVLETSPPDFVRKISRYLESNAGQNKQEKEFNKPKELAEADSDSGDSLFLTQKQVPEAVRSGRRHHLSHRSKPVSPRDLEESGADTSSSASDGEAKTNKKYKRKTWRLPRYNFPFLSGPRCLTNRQNRALHNAAMGGFLKSLRDGYQREITVESLPTVDTEGEYISPLSEEEEGERSEDDGIKVVERKCFLTQSKRKRRQTCRDQAKQQRQAGNARQETLQAKEAAKLSTLKVTRKNDKHVTSDGNIEGHLSQQKKKKGTEEEQCSDSDATICDELELQRNQQHKPQSLLHSLPDLIGNINDKSICNETKVKKRKKKRKEKECHESVEEETSQSQEEPKGLDASTMLNVGVAGTPSLSQDDGSEAEPESQSLLHSLPDIIGKDTDKDNESRVKKRKKKKKYKGDHESIEEEETGQSQEEPKDFNAGASLNVELDFNQINSVENLSQEERDIPSKLKKKKRKKDKSASEVDGNVEPDVRAEDAVENDGKKKKKKRKQSDKGDEQLQSNAAAEPLHDVAVIKKKKRKKGDSVVISEEFEEEEASNRISALPQSLTDQEDGPENMAASEETSESVHVGRKKRKKKRKSSSNGAVQDGEKGVDVSSSNEAATMQESAVLSPKKKQSLSDEDATQETKEGIEEQYAAVSESKKKTKKSEKSSNGMTDDNTTQSDDSVSVCKKKKKKTSSFLSADVVESGAQTHGEQDSPHVSGSHFETEFSNGVRKKKKKKKKGEMSAEENDHKRDFREPNNTCQSPLPESTDTGVKRKKKHKGNESEFVRPVEKLESAADGRDSTADEDIVEKKKKKSQDETPETPGNKAANGATDKKKKEKRKSAGDLDVEEPSSTSFAELERKITLSSPILSETSMSTSEKLPSVHNMRNKHTKAKKRLLNVHKDFLGEY